MLAFVFVTLGSISVYGQDATTSEGEPAAPVEATSGGDATLGEALFKANCASCHKLYKKAVGPALFQVSQ
ncbi:MAG: cytochrome c, partial [Nonlabens sp.]